jgi:hypothetical protein
VEVEEEEEEEGPSSRDSAGLKKNMDGLPTTVLNKGQLGREPDKRRSLKSCRHSSDRKDILKEGCCLLYWFCPSGRRRRRKVVAGGRKIEIEEKYSELSNFNRDENFFYGTLNRVELPTVTVYSE